MDPDPGARSDGRGPEEFRNVFINTGVISQANGSAYVEFNNTKIMVGVYGPRQSERKFGFRETGRLQCLVRMTNFASGTAGAPQQQQAIERSMSEAMQTALSASVQLDKMPKSCVDVFAMLLESGGSDLAVAVTAASVALADAGIELFDLVPACQVVKVGGTLLLDPSNAEEERCDGRAMVALMPAGNEITQLRMQGCWSEADTRDVMELCLGACLQLRAFMRDALVQASAAS